MWLHARREPGEPRTPEGAAGAKPAARDAALQADNR